MIYHAEVDANFNEGQNGVNTRTAEVRVYIRELVTYKLFKYFPISAEIVRETETDESYEIDFRRVYSGRAGGRILAKLGVQRFKKIYGGFTDSKELSIVLEDE